MNCRNCLLERNPLLVRRGGCATKKMSRSLRSGADGVVAHEVACDVRATTPSAPSKEASRIFFMSRPPLRISLAMLALLWATLGTQYFLPGRPQNPSIRFRL